MKWLMLIVGLVALAAVIISAVGAALPVKHRASRKARFHQPPQAIYAVVSGPPDWRPDVKASGPLPDANGRKRWWERDAHGEKIGYELIEDSPSRLVTRIAGDRLPFGGTWTIEIAPASPTESEVRVTEDGEIYNVIFRFLSRFVFGYAGSIEAYLRNLGAKFGEEPRIEA
ncbi:MAG: hypothetical protein WBY44_16470 [Bryobacteraceae bacterium]